MDFFEFLEDEFDEYFENITRPRRNRVICVRPNYFELLDDKDFRIRFRLTKRAVQKILIFIESDITTTTIAPTFFMGFANKFTQASQRTEYAIKQYYRECLYEGKASRQQDYLSSIERKRAKKNKKQKVINNCVFCENNKEPKELVQSHAVRDSLGRVLCPKLRSYVCPICGESGDSAHTIKYCPQKKVYTMEDMTTNALPQIVKLTEREIPYCPKKF